MKDFGQYEPSADARSQAAANWETYQAHLQAGFSPEQAMQYVLTVVHAIATAVVMKGDT